MLTDLRAADSLTATRRLSPVVIVAAVLALVFIAAGTLVATLFAPSGRDTSIVTGFILGTIAPTIVALMALIRGDHAAQVGEANAHRLAATATQIEQVAADVNGHLGRHDRLAESVAQVAETVAAAAGVQVAVPRDPDTRTRGTDEAPTPAPGAVPAQGDVPPVADQT